jgi:thymidylate synthase
VNNYLDLMRRIIQTGTVRHNSRTNMETRALFWQTLTFPNVGDDRSFPLVTTKQVRIKSVLSELLWFLSGESNIRRMHEDGVHIWDEWADENGELGRVYGVQWRHWKDHPWHGNDGREGEVDQIAKLIDRLKRDPSSRYHIVSAWNPAELGEMALAPCHMIWQCFVDADGRLSLGMLQRSCDYFLGVPFNIASYAALLIVLARCAELTPGDLSITFGDVHIYANHYEQCARQHTRQPYTLPTLALNAEPGCDIDSITLGDFALCDYEHHPSITAPIAVGKLHAEKNG